MEGSCTNYILEQTIQMKTGDICIIAPDTPHAISVFSDDSVIFNIILRTSTFETAFFGTLSDNDVLSDFFMPGSLSTPKLIHSCSSPQTEIRKRSTTSVMPMKNTGATANIKSDAQTQSSTHFSSCFYEIMGQMYSYRP